LNGGGECRTAAARDCNRRHVPVAPPATHERDLAEKGQHSYSPAPHRICADGDVVATPLHGIEQLICVSMMLSGSLLFAYLVGSFCGLAANLSPDTMQFRQDLTELNRFLVVNCIPKKLRIELREYMHQSLALRRVATGNRLLSTLAPKLRNEVAWKINKQWLQSIDLINGECETGLVLELAFALNLRIFPPGDSCPIGSIYIVSRGAALFAAKAFVTGQSWGEPEALLESDRLRFPIPATAHTYLFAYSVDGDVLKSTMQQAIYPNAALRLRQRQLHWILRRGVVRAAEDVLAERLALEDSGSSSLLRRKCSLKMCSLWTSSPLTKLVMATGAHHNSKICSRDGAHFGIQQAALQKAMHGKPHGTAPQSDLAREHRASKGERKSFRIGQDHGPTILTQSPMVPRTPSSAGLVDEDTLANTAAGTVGGIDGLGGEEAARRGEELSARSDPTLAPARLACLESSVHRVEIETRSNGEELRALREMLAAISGHLLQTAMTDGGGALNSGTRGANVPVHFPAEIAAEQRSPSSREGTNWVIGDPSMDA